MLSMPSLAILGHCTFIGNLDSRNLNFTAFETHTNHWFKIRAWKMRGIRFLHEVFPSYNVLYTLALSTIDKKFAHERCKVLAFYIKNFTFFSVLNMLCGRASTNHWLKIRMWKITAFQTGASEMQILSFLQCSKHALPIIE